MIGMLAAACCLFTGPPLISNAHVSSTTMISQPTITMMATGFGTTGRKKGCTEEEGKAAAEGSQCAQNSQSGSKN